MQLIDYLRFFRWPNLLIVAFTQYLLNYLILYPRFIKANIQPTLDHFHFFLLVLTTIILAAGAYLINDIKDYKIDTINKPERTFIESHLSKKAGLQLYMAILFMGLILALYLAFYVKQLQLVLIYPFVAALLYAYSVYLKCTPLLGNIVVALFCVFVPGIILFAERASFYQLQQLANDDARHIAFIFSFYIAFTFFATLYREIIKDLEDSYGDALNNCKTLAVLAGTKISRLIAVFFGTSLLLFLIWFTLLFAKLTLWIPVIFSLLFIVLPMLFSLYQLMRAKEKTQFYVISQLVKYIMIGGLILLFLL